MRINIPNPIDVAARLARKTWVLWTLAAVAVIAVTVSIYGSDETRALAGGIGAVLLAVFVSICFGARIKHDRDSDDDDVKPA